MNTFFSYLFLLSICCGATIYAAEHSDSGTGRGALLYSGLNAVQRRSYANIVYLFCCGTISPDKLRVFIAANPDIVRIVGNGGFYGLRTLLHWSAFIPESAVLYECLSILLEHGAFVDAKDANGDTVLLCLMRDRAHVFNKRIFDLLRAYGASLTVRNNQRQSPLELALDIGSVAIIQAIFLEAHTPLTPPLKKRLQKRVRVDACAESLSVEAADSAWLKVYFRQVSFAVDQHKESAFRLLKAAARHGTLSEEEFYRRIREQPNVVSMCDKDDLKRRTLLHRVFFCERVGQITGYVRALMGGRLRDSEASYGVDAEGNTILHYFAQDTTPDAARVRAVCAALRETYSQMALRYQLTHTFPGARSETPLAVVIERGSIAVIRFLLERFSRMPFSKKFCAVLRKRWSEDAFAADSAENKQWLKDLLEIKSEKTPELPKQETPVPSTTITSCATPSCSPGCISPLPVLDSRPCSPAAGAGFCSSPLDEQACWKDVFVEEGGALCCDTASLGDCLW